MGWRRSRRVQSGWKKPGCCDLNGPVDCGCLPPLANLGHDIGRGTIADILKLAGTEPAPERERKTTWAEFLRAHWEVLGATDFFTVEVWTLRGLVRYHVLFVIRQSTRKEGEHRRDRAGA